MRRTGVLLVHLVANQHSVARRAFLTQVPNAIHQMKRVFDANAVFSPNARRRRQVVLHFFPPHVLERRLERAGQNNVAVRHAFRRQSVAQAPVRQYSLHVVANGLFIKFQIWFKRNDSYDFIDISNLDYFIKTKNINLNVKSIEFPVSVKNPDFDVYTDGFGIDRNVGAAVCIFKDNALFSSYKFKLSSFNSVFQAELATINFAAGWALENGYRINIFTDSLSSIQVFKKSNSKSCFINEIKSKVFCALGSVGLSWVKVQAGIPGNELADQFAKAAIVDGEELLIPAHYSFLKKHINSLILRNWQRHWEESKVGLRVRDFVPNVNFNFQTHNRFMLFFVLGHGPFPFYLTHSRVTRGTMGVGISIIIGGVVHDHSGRTVSLFSHILVFQSTTRLSFRAF
ncbi:hypothetical protein AVEN_106606-1 [Araneus ventricosus]|uniref:RNase H type-1 domain-containing protein n=1 Tax=Araneus ventricosus TaxID=182803 RepID=A0A4Y2IW18_ARAVE|nr:hypothetical protein AVEN_106606-1 [Araneus ventricosus]